jgi:hypothetical protein
MTYAHQSHEWECYPGAGWPPSAGPWGTRCRACGAEGYAIGGPRGPIYCAFGDESEGAKPCPAAKPEQKKEDR